MVNDRAPPLRLWIPWSLLLGRTLGSPQPRARPSFDFIGLPPFLFAASRTVLRLIPVIFASEPLFALCPSSVRIVVSATSSCLFGACLRPPSCYTALFSLSFGVSARRSRGNDFLCSFFRTPWPSNADSLRHGSVFCRPLDHIFPSPSVFFPGPAFICNEAWFLVRLA